MGEDDWQGPRDRITGKVVAVEEEGNEADPKDGKDYQKLGLDEGKVLGDKVTHSSEEVKEEKAKNGCKVAFT